MYKGHKVISVTPAGRQWCLKILARYLLRERDRGLIDEHHFWVNTTNNTDKKYIRKLCSKYSFFKAIKCPVKVNWIWSIHTFFPKYIDDNTIYIRFDDDICYIADDTVEKLLEFRVNNPQYFLAYPVIINNEMNVNLFNPIPGGKHFYYDYKVAYQWHEDFLNGKKQWSFKTHEIEYKDRFHINCVCWTGKEFAKFDGKVGYDEEKWLTRVRPKAIEKPNAICGEAVVAHFGYQYHHNYFLGKTDLQKRYLELAPKWPKSPFFL